MKKTHFKIGLLTACLISVSSVASAQSCGAESCESGACKCLRKHCDDKGLLEVINNAASNFEGRLASMIPDRDKPRAKSKCNCDKCSAASDFAMQYTEFVPSHSDAYGNSPHFAPPIAQPDAVHLPVPRMMSPPNPITVPAPSSRMRDVVPQPDSRHNSPTPNFVPVPRSGMHEVVPLPDSRTNPFRDDPTTHNLRPVPARPASYLRSSNVKVEYDPQASNQKSMRSLSNSKAASKSISDSDLGLAKTSSTRRTQTEQSYLEQLAPEVVPASVSVPMSTLRDLTTIPSAADESVNPLRAK